MVTCPGDDTIGALLEGTLAANAAMATRAHLADCDACRQLVGAMLDRPSATHTIPTAPGPPIAIGHVVAGRYRVDRLLGEGGMGRVFAAQQLGLERPVALKILLPELARHGEALERFHREARLVAQLASEHAVRVHDFGEHAGQPFLVMELLDGEDLGAVLARGPVDAATATRWIAQACDALGEAHAVGIVHRDVKPSNLFLTRAGRIKVLDFGLAKLAGSATSTAGGALLGSPRYMAPEQVNGATTVDARADIWALGATLYHLVTGVPPFHGPTLEGLLVAILTGPPPRVDALPPPLGVAIARALARDPAARYATTAQLAAALGAGHPVLDDRFELVELLGQGGYGAVYRARQRPSGRDVAVKLLRAQAQRERFAREAAIAQRLEHPNTVRVFDAGVARDGAPFLVFELVRGRTLADEIARGVLSPERVTRIASQLLKALMEAHALGVVHRDLTPRNVLLVDHAGEPDFVKLCDFGVASDGAASTLTATGELVGTPRYMAPEQVGGHAVDGRCDLYALGLVMAEALSGRPVYDLPNAMAVCVAQASDVPPPIPRAVLAGPLGDVIARATAKPAVARYATAGEMLAALERGPGPHPSRARTRSLAIAGVAVVAALGGALAVAQPWRSSADGAASGGATSGGATSGAATSGGASRPSGVVTTPVVIPSTPTGHETPAAATGALANVDGTRLAQRLTALHAHIDGTDKEDFPGCHHTRIHGTQDNKAFFDLTLFDCSDAGMAQHEVERLRGPFRGNWFTLDGARMLMVASGPELGGSEHDSKALTDALLAP